MPTSFFSNAETSTLSHIDSERAWRPLHYLNLYRITLAALFVSAIYVKGNLPVLGNTNPALFQTVSFIYLGVSLIASFAIRLRWMDFRVLTYGLVVFDILSLTLVMRASGGIESGLGMLLIVGPLPVAAQGGADDVCPTLVTEALTTAGTNCGPKSCSRTRPSAMKRSNSSGTRS